MLSGFRFSHVVMLIFVTTTYILILVISYCLSPGTAVPHVTPIINEDLDVAFSICLCLQFPHTVSSMLPEHIQDIK